MNTSTKPIIVIETIGNKKREIVLTKQHGVSIYHITIDKEILLLRVPNYYLRYNRSKRNGSYKFPQEDCKRNLSHIILEANDFKPIAFDEPVQTIIYEGVENNRPIRLGQLPLMK